MVLGAKATAAVLLVEPTIDIAPMGRRRKRELGSSLAPSRHGWSKEVWDLSPQVTVVRTFSSIGAFCLMEDLWSWVQLLHTHLDGMLRKIKE